MLPWEPQRAAAHYLLFLLVPPHTGGGATESQLIGMRHSFRNQAFGFEKRCSEPYRVVELLHRAECAGIHWFRLCLIVPPDQAELWHPAFSFGNLMSVVSAPASLLLEVSLICRHYSLELPSKKKLRCTCNLVSTQIFPKTN